MWLSDWFWSVCFVLFFLTITRNMIVRTENSVGKVSRVTAANELTGHVLANRGPEGNCTESQVGVTWNIMVSWNERM